MSESPEWLREHQGAHLYTYGYVWECGDDECGCTQAMVVDYFQNKVLPRARVPINAWSGEFHTEHEPGADADLAEYRRTLKEADPEREAAIEWQGGVDYEARS